MVHLLVERATSDMLTGPDWARNIEICDICNYNPTNAKEIIKSIKTRLNNRSAKVQLLALTLVETIVKNCGDIVHMHIAEKELPHEMAKIVKKRILGKKLLEGQGRYPQYFAAYQELLRHGVVFPKRPETSAPVFTPLQTQPLTSYNESRSAAAESSSEAEYPTLCLTEIQKARGIMDVLVEC